MTIAYPKPAVREAWAATAPVWNGTTGDINDPGAAFTSAGWVQSNNPPPYQIANWAWNWSSAGVRYFMQRGIVDWDAGELYQLNAIVQVAGAVYISLQNTNTNHNPTTATAWWALAYITPAAGAASIASAIATAEAYTDASVASRAPLNSPALTGNPTAPTPPAGDSDQSIATTQFVNPGASLNGNGYAKQPSGLILQWGAATFSPGGLTVNFPIAYPNNCFQVLMTLQQVPGSGSPGWGVSSITKTSFVGYVGTSPTSCSWFAVGN